VGRFWSLLFLAVPVFGVGCFAWAMLDLPGMKGHWLPPDVSEHGRVIDNLFYFILYLTGVIFIATSAALFWFLWKYDAAITKEPVKFTHGSHLLEVVWSILPAVTLLFIAIYQMTAWADNKLNRPREANGQLKAPLAEVTGRQFEWRIRYAGKDGLIGTPDDLHMVNDLHVPIDEEIVLSIKSQDVLHSFFLPNLRVKQDVVPGMKQYVWFKPVEKGTYDIVCAELCGWGHYKMRGRITIESRADFDKWMEQKFVEQEQSVFTPAPKGDE
jgi:cytochrome c oxidase subunit 2